jgi:hypothetical protein
LGVTKQSLFLLGTIQISIQQEKWLIMPVFREDQAWFELRPKANVIFAVGKRMVPGVGVEPPSPIEKTQGVVRIRNFGFLANRKRATLLPLCFLLLGQPKSRKLDDTLLPLKTRLVFGAVRSVAAQ